MPRGCRALRARRLGLLRGILGRLGPGLAAALACSLCALAVGRQKRAGRGLGPGPTAGSLSGLLGHDTVRADESIEIAVHHGGPGRVADPAELQVECSRIQPELHTGRILAAQGLAWCPVAIRRGIA